MRPPNMVNTGFKDYRSVTIRVKRVYVRFLGALEYRSFSLYSSVHDRKWSVTDLLFN